MSRDRSDDDNLSELIPLVCFLIL